MSRNAPALLTVAPNGARRTSADHPALPITPAELAECARACVNAGASTIHLHVRDAAGGHTLDVAAYHAATLAIRSAAGNNIVIQATSESVGIYTPAQQMAMVHELRPEAVSVALRELCPAGGEDAARSFYMWAAGENIQLQHILYDAEDVRRLRQLQSEGIIPAGRPFVLFVLGRYSAGQRSDPADLLPFLTTWNHAGPWMVCAFGPLEARCAAAALALGGHVRVGFENNLLLSDGSTAPDNAALIDQARRLAETMGRPLANAQDVRNLGAL
jgi:uncharacterized protein (DUF849 family)